MNESLDQLRTYRLGSGELRRGKPNQSDSRMDGFFVGIGFVLLGFICGAVGWLIYTQQWHGVWISGGIGALIAFSGYSFFPIFSWVWSLLRYQQWPEVRFFDQFSVGQKYICVVMLAWGLVYGGNHLYPHLVNVGQKNPSPVILTTHQNANKCHRRHDQHVTYTQVAVNSKNANLPIQSLWIWAVVWLTTAEGLSFALNRLQRRRLKRISKLIAKVETTSNIPFSLWLGHSTGQLAQIAHGAALAARQSIALSVEDAAQNMVILGAIGSGKTTRAMHPLLLQLLDQDCGGLIFDIKGDFQTAVFTFAEHAGRKIIRFGPGFELTPVGNSNCRYTKVEVERKSHSTTKSKQSNPGQFLDSTSHSSTENVTLVEKAVLSPQLFRNLSPDEAVALLSVKGHSMDDVIQVMPVYV